MKNKCIISSRRDWIIVVEDKSEIERDGIYIPSNTDVKQNTCKRYKVVSKPEIPSEYVKDLCIGDTVLIRPDDLTMYRSCDSNVYYFVEEQFILGRSDE